VDTGAAADCQADRDAGPLGDAEADAHAHEHRDTAADLAG
jgi:hypothetical protein